MGHQFTFLERTHISQNVFARIILMVTILYEEKLLFEETMFFCEELLRATDF